MCSGGGSSGGGSSIIYIYIYIYVLLITIFTSTTISSRYMYRAIVIFLSKLLTLTFNKHRFFQ